MPQPITLPVTGAGTLIFVGVACMCLGLWFILRLTRS